MMHGYSRRRSAILLAFVVLTALGMAGIPLEAAAETEDPMTTWVTAYGPGRAVDVEIQERIVYVAVTNGLFVIDTSEGGRSFPTSFLPLPGTAYEVDVSGDYAYVACGGAGLRIIDVSDPLRPVELGTFGEGTDIREVAVEGTIVDLIDGDALRILMTSDPHIPKVLSEYSFEADPTDISVDAGIAFVPKNDGRLTVLSVIDPTNPHKKGDWNEESANGDISISNGKAVLSYPSWGWYYGHHEIFFLDVINPLGVRLQGSFHDKDLFFGPAVIHNDLVCTTLEYEFGQGSMIILDLFDPSDPQIIGSSWIQGGSNALDLSEDRAVVATDSGVYIYDTSHYQGPRRAGGTGTAGRQGDANAIAIKDEFIYLALNDGFAVIDNSNAMANLASYRELPDRVSGIDIQDNELYLACNEEGFYIYDISDPGNPERLILYNTSGNTMDIAVQGDYVYVADGHEGLMIWNISSPAHPVLAGESVFEHANTVHYQDGLVYVGSHSYGLRILDVSDPASINEIGHYDSPGNAYHTTVIGNKAYLADYFSGLLILDISDPTAPSLIGQVDTPGRAKSVDISGNRAFVADWSGDLQIIDISHPSNPELNSSLAIDGDARDVIVKDGLIYVASTSGLLIGESGEFGTYHWKGGYVTGGYTKDVEIQDGVAFVADDDGGLRILDISDPSELIDMGNYLTWDPAYDLELSEDYAYLSVSERGLLVMDISVPSRPELVGEYTDAGEDIDLCLAGDHLYMADRAGKLTVLDISVSSDPRRVWSTQLEGVIRDADIEGDYLYLVSYGQGLLVYELSNPASPSYLGNFKNWGRYGGIDVVGDRAFIADISFGLQVLDVSVPSAPELLGHSPSIISYRPIKVIDDRAFIAPGYGGFQILDISDPTDPWNMGRRWERDYRASGIEIVGDHAYIGGYQELLEVVDLSVPFGPSEIVFFPMSGLNREFELVGDLLYVASSTGLSIHDLTEPLNPEKIGNYYIPSGIEDIAIQDGIAYLGDSRKIYFIDISDPFDPRLLNEFVSPYMITDVKLDGSHMYLGQEISDLRVYDVFDVTDPVEVGSYRPDDHKPRDILIRGDLAYVADERRGISILDISDVSNISEVGKYRVPGWVNGIELIGDIAFVTTDYSPSEERNGLWLIDVSDPEDPVELDHLVMPKGAWDVKVSGDLAFVAVDYNNFSVVDISDPRDIEEIEYFHTNGQAYNILLMDELILLSCSDRQIQVLIFDHEPPTAHIDTVPMTLISREDMVAFTGHGEDSDGVIWESVWSTSIDGFIGNGDTLITSGLSPGNHTVYFKVRDDLGMWSETVRDNFSVRFPPVAKIDTIDVDWEGETATVTFQGHGKGENEILEYEWSSDLDGLLGSGRILKKTGLSPGQHNISLRVRDPYGWSDPTIEGLVLDPPPKEDESTGSILIMISILAVILVVCGILLIRRRGSRLPTENMKQDRLVEPLTNASPGSVSPTDLPSSTQPPPPPPAPPPTEALVLIQCPGCQARMEIQPLGKVQKIKCEACGLEGEADI